MMVDFLITYDASSKDDSVICVTRKRGKYIDVVKCLVGDKADELYKLLKNQDLDFEIKERDHE